MNIPLQGAAKAATVIPKDRFTIALRLLFPLALLEAALWAPMPLGVLCGVGALWYVGWQLRQAASDVRSLGLEVRGLLHNFWLLGAAVALALTILAIAHFSGSLHRLWGLQHPYFAIAGYVCWAFVQEFMLQCFCLRMLRALVSRVGSLLLSGVVFSAAHLPNPSLTLITFFAGVMFTAIYVRKRNLYVVALIHAVLGLTLAVSAPEEWFHGLRVGRDFLNGPTAITVDITPTR